MAQAESKDILKSIFSVSTDGIVCIDLIGNILFANDSFAELLGYSFGEIQRMNIHQLFAEDVGFNKLFSKNDPGEKLSKRNIVSKKGESISVLTKSWRQKNGLSDGTVWFLVKNPLNNELKKKTLKKDIHEQLRIVENCLRNLQQDVGGEINDVDDYISFASEACSKTKEFIDELSGYSSTDEFNHSMNFYIKDSIEIIGQIN